MKSYRRHPATVSTELGEEIVVLQLDTKRYYTLNESAACAWRALDGRADEQVLAAALSREYAIEPADAAPQVTQLIRRMLDWQLVEECR